MEELSPFFARFGISYLLPYQTLCIHHILRAGGIGAVDDEHKEFSKKRIVLLPTGYGKTVCFALPALILPHPTLVIYPLRSLMADQERRFAKIGVDIAVLRGGQKPADRAEALTAISTGKAKIVIANPEVLETQSIKRALSNVRFSHLVLDEAHVVSQWGKSFRPAYWRLRDTIGQLKVDQLSAFTATADTNILNDLRDLIGDCEHYELQAPPDRPNISYRVLPCNDAISSLVCLLRGSPTNPPIEGPILIFCPSRALCEWLSLRLRYILSSKELRFYHAGLSHAEKAHTEHWFFHSDNGILAATTAYGMGIDKSNIRTVVHVGRPSSLAAFLQESGRAGRDGTPAYSIVLHTLSSPPPPGPDLLDGFMSGRECRRAALMRGLAAELDYCSGCDVCDGAIAKLAPEEQVILDFVRNHKAMFVEHEAAREISVRRLLPGFDELRIARCIRTMLVQGNLRRSRSILSPGRIVVGESRKEYDKMEPSMDQRAYLINSN